MSRMSKKLHEWKSKGLLSQGQFDAIVTYEDSLPRTDWTQLSFLIMGVGTIVLGVISLIAYNWEIIPVSVKLSVGFSILFAVAAAIYLPIKRKSVLVQDGLIVFFGLYCFAMIGLVAQIYNLNGPAYQTGLFWSAITLLLAASAAHVAIPLFWTLIFTLSLLSGCYEWQPLKEALISHFTFFVLLLGVAAIIMRRFLNHSLIQDSLEYAAIAFGLIATFATSIHFSYPSVPAEFKSVIPHLVLAVVGMALVHFEPSLKKFSRTMMVVVFLLLAISTALYAHNSLEKVIQTLLGIMGLFAWALAFYAQNYRKFFNLTMGLVAIKIFEIFMVNSSGLLSTGVGLLMAGCLVLLAIYGWNKNKALLESRLQELIK